MSLLKVQNALRVDQPVKFCKRLKVWSGGTGKRESALMPDSKMLLLVQNEIGQIVGRRLTRSENHDEAQELLQHLKNSFSEADSQYVISDNANAIRNLVSKEISAAVNSNGKGPPSERLTKIQHRVESLEAAMTESVLCLSAIVLAFPHDVPAFVPPIIEELDQFLYMK
ncbi:hypothetical protein JG688_00007818 [Phytophthora aleatoria]|uniref:Proteasome activator complex subunit 4 C-terminal domain-containing protein n=1 Tax=Phytophthora aleatoria TaxID=2496075 RepID=A0A8J5IUY6_9STRA|nr:hypothetical protein JG688_00007818 [Phytophthora aleatoria]